MKSGFPERLPELPEVSDQVADFIGRCVSGTASAEEWRELNDLLDRDEDALAYFVAYTDLNASLIVTSPDIHLPTATKSQTENFGSPIPTDKQRMVTVLAACAVIALLMTWVVRSQMQRSTEEIARITFSSASDLQVIDGANSNREIPAGGSIRFSDGSVGVSLAAGVDMVIEGPAELQVVHRNALRLLSGSLIADAHGAAEAISIEAQRCTVNDQGGRFGLSSFAGQPDSIAVFQGKMHVAQQRNTQVLRKGDAIQIDESGKIVRLSSVVAGLFPDERDINRTAHHSALIASVQDNIIDDSDYGFYQVAPKGFGEDAPAYVDRNHQWNGIGPDAIPHFLRGAEYVKTMDYDRIHEEALQIDLELRAPANVYILYTECFVVPDWLSRDYVDTGFRVGLDEGPYFDPRIEQDQHAHTELGVGPNCSIEGNFSVWLRKVPEAGTIRLGGVDSRRRELPKPKYGSHDGSNMYGIVVTPLE
ncbi:hypothetical protein M4951_15905 [Blastopirellula sp. J2-11]|uniref:hypothetical protein n=1 Tax=Blastopirellula sp. J2-11 TaxID=2943192 RepID=UPI0021C960D7|nr:hypothetical protein [Blastopirellula sp. J2-11]UUO04868.1 hypothetical protein M4951_15905 [Blastopirellula sp. J2-11]